MSTLWRDLRTQGKLSSADLQQIDAEVQIELVRNDMISKLEQLNSVHGVWVRRTVRQRKDEDTGEIEHLDGWAASHGRSAETHVAYYLDDEAAAFGEVVDWVEGKTGTLC